MLNLCDAHDISITEVDEGYIAFSHALRNGHQEFAQMMIDEGLYVNDNAVMGLMYCVMKSDDYKTGESIFVMLREEEEFGDFDPLCMMRMMYDNGLVEIMRNIYHIAFDPNSFHLAMICADFDTDRTLAFAIICGCVQIVEYLLKQVSIVDSSTIALALKWPNDSVLDALLNSCRKDVIDALRRHGGHRLTRDFESKNERGHSSSIFGPPHNAQRANRIPSSAADEYARFIVNCMNHINSNGSGGMPPVGSYAFM